MSLFKRLLQQQDGQADSLTNRDEDAPGLENADSAEAQRMEAQLLQYPDIVDAAVVRTLSQLETGPQLYAFVMINDKPDPAAWADFTDSVLSPLGVPYRRLVVKSLPLLESGELDRRQVAAWATVGGMPVEEEGEAHG